MSQPDVLPITRRTFVASSTGMLAGGLVGAATAKSPAQGAAAARPQAGKKLRAGAATSNITPPLGVTMDGTIMQIGGATHVHDELHARCLVLDDGRERLAIVVCDNTMISRELLDRAKQLVHQHAKLPPNRMLISATHTHSTPRMVGIGTTKIDDEYSEFLVRRIADSVRRAINNLAPAKIGWGLVQKPELVFNRRWRMRPGSVPANPFGQTGEQVQMNPRRGSANLVEPAGPVDPELSFVSVRHADGRPLALLANFGIHYVGGTVRGHLSADYFGAFSRRIAQVLDAARRDSGPPFVGIMSNGTSGDISSGSTFLKPAPRKAAWVRIGEVAHELAESVRDAERQIDYRDAIPLAMRQSELELAVRRPSAERLVWAEKVHAGVQLHRRLSRPEIYAREAIMLAKFPPTVKIVMQALRLGSLGIAAIPCEVFAETGLAIKAASPLQPSFTIELANGYGGYLPTPAQHKLGGYETWPARSSFMEIDAETKIRATAIQLLKQVAQAGDPA